MSLEARIKTLEEKVEELTRIILSDKNTSSFDYHLPYLMSIKPTSSSYESEFRDLNTINHIDKTTGQVFDISTKSIDYIDEAPDGKRPIDLIKTVEFHLPISPEHLTINRYIIVKSTHEWDKHLQFRVEEDFLRCFKFVECILDETIKEHGDSSLPITLYLEERFYIINSIFKVLEIYLNTESKRKFDTSSNHLYTQPISKMGLIGLEKYYPKYPLINAATPPYIYDDEQYLNLVQKFGGGNLIRNMVCNSFAVKIDHYKKWFLKGKTKKIEKYNRYFGRITDDIDPIKSKPLTECLYVLKQEYINSSIANQNKTHIENWITKYVDCGDDVSDDDFLYVGHKQFEFPHHFMPYKR
jgi:hypothetical protein